MCSAFNASKASIKVNFDAICQEENSMTVANANGLATIPTKVTKPIEMIKVIVISSTICLMVHSGWKSPKMSHFIEQKFIRNTKMVNLAIFVKSVACGQRVLPDRSIVNYTNVDGKCQNNRKFKCDIFGDFHLVFVKLDFQTSWISFCVTRCLKITEKVSFNITSEASYV